MAGSQALGAHQWSSRSRPISELSHRPFDWKPGLIEIRLGPVQSLQCIDYRFTCRRLVRSKLWVSLEPQSSNYSPQPTWSESLSCFACGVNPSVLHVGWSLKVVKFKNLNPVITFHKKWIIMFLNSWRVPAIFYILTLTHATFSPCY